MEKVNCLIHISGTLSWKVQAKTDGRTTWEEAKAVAVTWEEAGSWDSPSSIPGNHYEFLHLRRRPW